MDHGPKFPHLRLALKRLFLALGYAYAAIWFIPMLIGAARCLSEEAQGQEYDDHIGAAISSAVMAV